MLMSVPTDVLNDAADFTLSKTRKNEVGQEIQETGLSPEDFEWRDDTQSRANLGHSGFTKVSALIHRPTKSHFIFEMQPLPRHLLLPQPQHQGWFAQQNAPAPQLGCEFRPGDVASVEALNVLDWSLDPDSLGRLHEAPDLDGVVIWVDLDQADWRRWSVFAGSFLTERAKSKLIDRAEEIGWRTVGVSSKRASVPGLTAAALASDKRLPRDNWEQEYLLRRVLSQARLARDEGAVLVTSHAADDHRGPVERRVRRRGVSTLLDFSSDVFP
jgi:hypothetical protein